MGICLCLNGESEKSQYLMIKGENKRFLPEFPGAPNSNKGMPRIPSKNLNNNLLDETGGKNTPAALMYYNEESLSANNSNSNKEEKKPPAFEHFNIKKVIGKGSYGRVLLVEKKDTGYNKKRAYSNILKNIK